MDSALRRQLGTDLLIYALTLLTHSSSTQKGLHANNQLVLPNLTTKLENIRNIKIQSAVFMLLHVNTHRWTDKAIYQVFHMAANAQNNKTCFMPKTLLFVILLSMKQLNKRDRTCQNRYATHAFLNLFYSCLQCVLGVEILYAIITKNFG